MPQLDSDTFPYGDNASLAVASSNKWADLSGIGVLGIASNKVFGAPAADGAGRVASWSGSTTAQYSQVTYRGGSGDQGGPAILMSAVDDYVFADFVPGDQCYVIECLNGSTAQLSWATGSGTFHDSLTDGDTLYIEVQGTTITVKQNGFTLGTATVSSVTTGNPGIGMFGGGFQVDAWVAGDFASSVVTVPELDHTQAHRPFNMTSGRR